MVRRADYSGNRVCPLRVKEAYERLGVKPMRGIYAEFGTKTGEHAACGLGVLKMDRDGIRSWSGKQVRISAQESLDLNPAYIYGFIAGFDYVGDGSHEPKTLVGSTWARWEDGREAARLIFWEPDDTKEPPSGI